MCFMFGCCDEDPPTVPPYYTIRGCSPSTFHFNWKGTVDGEPDTNTLPFSKEHEIQVFGSNVLVGGYIHGDYVVTEWDSSGSIVKQSDPTGFAYRTTWTGYIHVEVGDTVVWAIQVRDSLTADVACFDAANLDQISEFTVSTTPEPLASFRAIGDDLVVTATANTVATVLWKYDETGFLVDTLGSNELVMSGTIQQARPYVSRHRRAHDDVLFHLVVNDPGAVRRFALVDLATFGVTEGSNVDETSLFNADRPTVDVFSPDGSVAVLSSGSALAAPADIRKGCVSLSSLDYNWEGTSTTAPSWHTCRVTNTYAVCTDDDQFLSVHRVSDGVTVWSTSGSPARAVGMVDIIDLGVVVRSFNAGIVVIYDISTGGVLYNWLWMGAYYVRQEGSVVYATNSKSIARIP